MRSVRRTALQACIAAAAALAAVRAAAPLHAEDDGHDHGREAEVSLSDLSKEERVVALEAWAHVYCKCPDENWSRTLSNCPDGCAREQKQQILGRIREGWDVKRIVEEQVKLYTSKAAADPGSAWNGTYLVVFGVLAGAAAAGFVLSRWRRAAGEKRAAADFLRSAEPGTAAEAAAVERELQEID